MNEIRYSPREVDKHFKGKKDTGNISDDANEEENKKTKSFGTEYYKKYFEDNPAIKKRQRTCSREHMRRIRHPTEKRTEEVLKLVENMKNYPTNFPEKEFNKKLDEMLKYNPSEVKEKTLRDLIYDILDKEKLLTPQRMMNLYYNSNWANAIGEFMKERNYIKNGEDKYIPVNPQTSRK